MKYTVIDIGSNSVRLMAYKDGVTLYKKITVTRLSEGMQGGMLQVESIDRTAEAVLQYFDYACKVEGCIPLVFATEALRSAKNAQQLLEKLPMKVDIISGETEAKIGYLGAKQGFDGVNLMIDIGGASTEIVVGEGENIIYAKSCPVGVVRLLNNCGENIEKLQRYINENIAGYGEVPAYKRAIVLGGTGLNLVSCVNNIVPYDSARVNKANMSYIQLSQFLLKIKALDKNARMQLGVHEKRCDIIYGGGQLLLSIMRHISATCVVASERDNLEGYIELYEKQS